MNISLADKGQLSKEDVIRITSGCLRQTVGDAVRIGHGRNSQVYHLTPQDYVVKFYYQDSRDRLGIEFKSTSFLWEQGLRLIPKPVALSREYSCAFYEFIKGTQPTGEISRKDIDGAVYFLEILKGLSSKAMDFNFSGASEAFFCGRDIVKSLRARMDRFPAKDTPEYADLRKYLEDEFLPLLESVGAWSKDYIVGQGISWIEEIPMPFRTLSPSDFGFHNALRTSAGSMVFLDFEYFGWDDPAKLVSDFLWHPAMKIPEDLKSDFVQRMSIIFGHSDPYFRSRLRGIFPLFGLKWCLIFLNEFSPKDVERREFAQPDFRHSRLEQLAKAREMGKTVRAIYKEFPYGC